MLIRSADSSIIGSRFAYLDLSIFPIVELSPEWFGVTHSCWPNWRCTPSLRRPLSVVESIAELDINLPWVVPVESTEGLAVVEIHSTVGHI